MKQLRALEGTGRIIVREGDRKATETPKEEIAMDVDRAKIEHLGNELECREECESEIWERVELTPISVQDYLQELIELTKELAEAGCGCGSGCDRSLETPRARRGISTGNIISGKGTQPVNAGDRLMRALGAGGISASITFQGTALLSSFRLRRHR